jgi:glycosyltransferase involved in cell wall biosynthesis
MKTLSAMKISVIVPVLNEENTICALLDGLCGQTRRPDEIVITDGGSTDNTAKLVEAYDSNGVKIRLFRELAALPGRGRNIGTANAENDWIAFIDAGIRPDPRWLEYLESAALADPELEVVYGSWEPVTDTFFKECAAISYVPPPNSRNGKSMRPHSIASCLIQRRVWRLVGGFPEHLRSAEDLLFMNEVERAGVRIGHAELAMVRWDLKDAIYPTFLRFITYSRNNIRAGLWKHWQRAIFRRYLFLAVAAILAIGSGWRWLAVPILFWMGLLFLRAIVAIRRNLDVYPAKIGKNILRLFLLVPILAVLDAAAMIGAVIWLFKDKFASDAALTGAKNGA